ncbi:hypothetical protein MHYP_G00069740 [Metynnis hypsauchen]
MRTYLLLFLSLAVAVGLPVHDWVPVESVEVAQRERSPLLADLLPEQGHVVQEDPKPVARKESVVQEKAAEPSPVQQNEPVKVKSLAEDVPPVKKQEADTNEVVKKIELKNEPVMDVKDQDKALMEQVEIAEEALTAQEPVKELEPVLEMQEVHQRNPRWRTCTGVVINSKCYQFFRGPKRAADAETGRFIWLDGTRWGYADWLPGEPNNTAGVENCVELLSNGKFNDMPCWDLRAFICSYPY